MDSILRILRQAAANDPAAKDRYIRALERSIGGAAPLASYNLVELVRDIEELGMFIGNFIEQDGAQPTNNAHIVVWVDPQYRDAERIPYRQGLALGTSTRGVASALVALFDDNFNKWSASPVLPYDEVSESYHMLTRYIYLWEITA